MKRSLALTTLMVFVLSGLLLIGDAWARVGGGGSSGSRGSRSYSAPVSPSPSPMSPSRPTTPPPTSPPFQTSPQRSGWGGMLGGLLVGGLIGSLLFGGMGHGGFGGFGFLELLVIGGLVYLAFRFMRSRQTEPAGAGGYSAPREYGSSSWQSQTSSSYGSTAGVEALPEATDLDRGLSQIRQMDSGFDPTRFADTATDLFFKIQAAWTQRDLDHVTDLLTPEMRDVLQKDCDRLRAERRINRLENIAVRRATVTEAWQERGQDFATVYFVASLVDYTTDESGTRVLDGNPNEPVKFEEYWTFARPVGPNPWKLSAIQQPT